jgi:hypothetical protein
MQLNQRIAATPFFDPLFDFQNPGNVIRIGECRPFYLLPKRLAML